MRYNISKAALEGQTLDHKVNEISMPSLLIP